MGAGHEERPAGDADGAPVRHPWRVASAQVFVEDLGSPELTESDAHHLLRVLRIGEGAPVCAADGVGGWRMCALRGSRLEVVGESDREPRPEPTLTVGFAAPKGDRTEWAVRKLTEVGVDRIAVLRTERSVVRWDADRAGKRLERMRRWALEASRQCRRLWLPEVVLAAMGDLPDAAVADPEGRAVSPGDHSVLVGPEGGFSDVEREGRGSVALGEYILRTETAAVVAGSAMASLRLWSGRS